MGLILNAIGQSGVGINLFSPNDYWIVGTRYNFFHWNGSNFAWVDVPGLPNDGSQYGWQCRFIKTKTGRLFIPSEVSSQAYVVIHGTP